MDDFDQVFEDAFDDDDLAELLDDDDDLEAASSASSRPKQPPPPSVAPLPRASQQPPHSSQPYSSQGGHGNSGWSVSPFFSSSPHQPPSSPAANTRTPPGRFSKPTSQEKQRYNSQASRPPSQTFRTPSLPSSSNVPSTQASNNRNTTTGMAPSQSRITYSNQTTLTRNYKVSGETDGNSSNNWEYTSNSQLAQDTTPTHHELDESMLSIYIYPTNLSVRDYQKNIIKRALFENVLCALPTGLGKTFIASTVILNYYRWTRTGKIIFMAPTRPLVSQQLEACLGITGLPRSDSSILIGGSMTPIMREEEWATKRVFFATPQTVDNDLKRGVVDPKSIACIVIDEAHRATGNHAYVGVVSFIARFNQSFRVLALTATPSTTLEGVQAIITNLRISRAEIRTEDSPDISKYIHKKDVTRLVSGLSDDQHSVLEPLSRALAPLIRDVAGANVLHVTDPANLNQFAAVSAMKTVSGRFSNNPIKFKYLAILKILASMGHAVNLLKYHGIRPFYNFIQTFEREHTGGKGGDDSGKSKKKPGKHVATLLNSQHYHDCVAACEKLIFHGNSHHIVRDRFLGHPKLEELVRVTREFFVEAWALEQPDSKAIIFSAYRDSGVEIERVLKVHVPECRPHLFIGQAAGKGDNSGSQGTASSGSSGMSQKEQQRVVDEFKAGTINTLIATSIGEEGLDIGEVDLIICYDASSSPIRMLQRMGRTGRKRAGKIYMLLADNEEKKLDKSFDNYKYIQRLIQDNPETDQLEFCLRHRMLPQDVRPECVEMTIDIPEENKELLAVDDIVREAENAQRERLKKNKGRPLKRAAKKFNMPDGVETGFVSAGTGKRLGSPVPTTAAPEPKRAKGAGGRKSKKATINAFFDDAAADDDGDEDLDDEEESGLSLLSSFINDKEEDSGSSDEDPFGLPSEDSIPNSNTRAKSSRMPMNTTKLTQNQIQHQPPKKTASGKSSNGTKSTKLSPRSLNPHRRNGDDGNSDGSASALPPTAKASALKHARAPLLVSSTAAVTMAAKHAAKPKPIEKLYYYDAQRDGPDYGVYDRRAPVVPRAERATSSELLLPSSPPDLTSSENLFDGNNNGVAVRRRQQQRKGTQSIISRHFTNLMQRLHSTDQARVAELERNLDIEDCIVPAAPLSAQPEIETVVAAATDKGSGHQRKRGSERKSEVIIDIDSDSEEEQVLSRNHPSLDGDNDEEDEEDKIVVRRRPKAAVASRGNNTRSSKKKPKLEGDSGPANKKHSTTATGDCGSLRPKQPRLEALFDSDSEA
ncbi:similar to Saccharomyces cerevisiae YIR002C MPH1 3'-5' DNA helicase involved in error-free bypass of DNA lesions [Geotrichum candidum]|uniref:ATP-dependent DNA helicase n=1 Tax=Geotrichum candidum TaxID=1173061 RepID=A0A0J9XD97_GEOCN|nr:similar to Saccharomyces cerevisiae YIR002C MPH1 3'-5' DNA helicase involved in error-free bypass of DNA lesions [Geotrichum candidum]